jgi:NAD(P)H-dependent FMN reductase
MKLFAIAGSRRTGSLNGKLLGIAAEILRGRGVVIDLAALRDFDLPFYDGDLEAAGQIPAGATALAARIAGADGLLVVSPEYNYSLPGELKNAIDWMSRLKPMPLRGKRALLLSASPSLVGGNRGVWALRVPLEGLGVHVFPEMYSLASAHQNLAGDGIADPLLAKMLDGMLERFAGELRRGL